jgi:hypothetical protein
MEKDAIRSIVSIAMSFRVHDIAAIHIERASVEFINRVFLLLIPPPGNERVTNPLPTPKQVMAIAINPEGSST